MTDDNYKKKLRRMPDMPIGKQDMTKEDKRAIAQGDDDYQPLFKKLSKEHPLERRY